jgi:hypothetical protein
MIPYIQVLRVMNGEIVHLRDYFSLDNLRPSFSKTREQIERIIKPEFDFRGSITAII